MKIDPSLFCYFENAGRILTYPAQTTIYMQEDPADYLYLIRKGKVRIYMMNNVGDDITLTVLGAGNLFGESSFLPQSLRPTTADTLTNVELIACHINDLYPFFHQSKDLTLALLQTLSQTCDHLSLLIKKAYTYNRNEKVIAFLLEQVHHSDQLTYTHEEIATFLGLARVTVTKVLNKLRKDGYIQQNYKTITIINKKGLMSLLQKS